MPRSGDCRRPFSAAQVVGSRSNTAAEKTRVAHPRCCGTGFLDCLDDGKTATGVRSSDHRGGNTSDRPGGVLDLIEVRIVRHQLEVRSEERRLPTRLVGVTKEPEPQARESWAVLPMKGGDSDLDGDPTERSLGLGLASGEVAPNLFGESPPAVRSDGRSSPGQLLISPATAGGCDVSASLPSRRTARKPHSIGSTSTRGRSYDESVCE